MALRLYYFGNYPISSLVLQLISTPFVNVIATAYGRCRNLHFSFHVIVNVVCLDDVPLCGEKVI